jgi:hypothetical protein
MCGATAELLEPLFLFEDVVWVVLLTNLSVVVSRSVQASKKAGLSDSSWEAIAASWIRMQMV